MPNTLLHELRELSPAIAEREAAAPDAYPAETIADLKRLGIPAAPFERAAGGHGASLPEAVALTRALAEASPSAALMTTMPLGLAGIFALPAETAPEEHRTVWREQCDRVAGEYRHGTWFAACNSEKGAGGSLKDIKTTVEQREDGSYALSGEKILASAGRFADVFFSTAKFPDDRVEFFFIDTKSAGVEILDDWDGFGMRSTESQTVRYTSAISTSMVGYPGFLDAVQPLGYWFCLFAAIPLGCASAVLRALSTPAPTSPALRLRYSEATMRIEAMSAYLQETASLWRPAGGKPQAMRVLRTKTYVTSEATKLCAEMFALSGGRHYTRTGRIGRMLADSFAGTALRPPLPLALDTLVAEFE